MKIEKLLRSLALDGGSRILAIDEARAGHEGRSPKDAEAAQARAPTAVAIIPLMGAVRARGAYGMEGFRARMGAAAGNADVGAIILDVDSPGGTYHGTPEAAAAVAAAAQAKPVIAMVDTLAASAAYWIASQASQIVMTPSADVGSIGVLAVHHDLSQMLENDGVKTTIVRSTPYKAEASPFEPLSPEALANWQAEVARAHAEFERAVASGRRVSLTKVQTDFGKGRTMGAQAALAAGMIDRIGAMADVLSGMRTKHAFRRRSALSFA